MEFSKKEKDIKEILERRKIQPSDELWDKLERELDQAQKKSYFYYYFSVVAAVLIVVFLIGGKLWFNSSAKLLNHQVADREMILDENNSQESFVSEEKEASEADEIKEQTTGEKKLKTQFDLKHLPQKDLVSRESRPKNITSSKNSSEEKTKIPQESLLVNIENQENMNTEDLVEDLIKKVETELSLEQEAEQLLAEVMRGNSETPDNKINAVDLLAEIEAELPEDADRNLKEQMHQFLKEGWDKAKIALALNK